MSRDYDDVIWVIRREGYVCVRSSQIRVLIADFLLRKPRFYVLSTSGTITSFFRFSAWQRRGIKKEKHFQEIFLPSKAKTVTCIYKHTACGALSVTVITVGKELGEPEFESWVRLLVFLFVLMILGKV